MLQVDQVTLTCLTNHGLASGDLVKLLDKVYPVLRLSGTTFAVQASSPEERQELLESSLFRKVLRQSQVISYVRVNCLGLSFE